MKYSFILIVLLLISGGGQPPPLHFTPVHPMPQIVHKGHFYQMVENPETDIWELHVFPILPLDK